MKKKTQITKRITTTESIDIVKEVSVPKTENSPLVASSPLRFTNFTGFVTTDEETPASFKPVVQDDEETSEGSYQEVRITPRSDDIVSVGWTKSNEAYAVRRSDLNDFQEVSSRDVIVRDQGEPPSTGSKISAIKKILPSVIVATGTGLAMMPIFNKMVKNSEQFGLDIHSDKYLFNSSTANTFIVAYFSSFSNMYSFIKKHQDILSPDSKHVCISVGKAAASLSIVLPLGLLWSVELSNQKIAGSSGFDEFMAWATFTTLPLVIDRIADSSNTFDKLYNKDYFFNLNTTGSKMVVYGLAALSVAGRSIAFTEVAKQMAIAMGLSPEVALGAGIVIGGVLGSGGTAVFEYQAVKSLFEVKAAEYNPKTMLIAAFSTAEGVWFTLPIISLGLTATEGWNPLLKGALLVPLLASHTTLEATRIYDNVSNFCDYVSDGISSIKDWCFGNNDIQLAGDITNADVEYSVSE